MSISDAKQDILNAISTGHTYLYSIARHLNRNKSSLHQQLKELVTDGYLTRTTKDNRLVIYTPTNKRP